MFCTERCSMDEQMAIKNNEHIYKSLYIVVGRVLAFSPHPHSSSGVFILERKHIELNTGELLLPCFVLLLSSISSQDQSSSSLWDQKNYLRVKISNCSPVPISVLLLDMVCHILSLLQCRLLVAINLKNSFFCCHLPVYFSAASRLRLCLNPNCCIYHSLYSCIIGGRGV